MFTTNEADKNNFTSRFGDVAETHWHMVELTLHMSWFLLTLRKIDNGGPQPWRFMRTFLLSSLEQIEKILEQIDPAEIAVETLKIILPGPRNSTSQWEMEDLHRVWVAREAAHPEHRALIYETKSGQRYADSSLGTSVDELVVEKLRFQVPYTDSGKSQ